MYTYILFFYVSFNQKGYASNDHTLIDKGIGSASQDWYKQDSRLASC